MDIGFVFGTITMVLFILSVLCEFMPRNKGDQYSGLEARQNYTTELALFERMADKILLNRIKIELELQKERMNYKKII